MPTTPQTQLWVKRHTRITRITHWIWAMSLFFLLLTGLQIFNAHPILYWGDQSGFGFDNSVFVIGGAESTGHVQIGSWRISTTGIFFWSNDTARAFPAWATIPSGIDLATGRVVHFFFAWLLVGTLLVWLIGGVWSGHIWHDLCLKAHHWRGLWVDIQSHARLRFPHTARYGSLQRLTYGLVLFVLFPLIIASGLAMSPGMNAALPWLAEGLGGRQSARTLHFVAAFGLSVFVLIHVAMVILAGPLNEMRAIVTGWYRADQEHGSNA